jgi:hypothetical protein
MALYERVGNIHIHTTYSDGTGGYDDLAEAAHKAGLDYLITTDHNVYLGRHEGWVGDTLVLVDEEVHDPSAADRNHYLVFNAHEEMASYGDEPQRLIDAVQARKGIGFIAHPYEHSGAYTDEPEINWRNWEVTGYNGLEIWNYMSEFKSYVSSLGKALLYVFAPKLAITGPYPETLAQWDRLLAGGKVFAIGGSDAHATVYELGLLKRAVFGYEHLFRAVNTHILVTAPWNGDVDHDGQLVYDALAAGKAFIGYDALAPTKGFRFVAEQGEDVYTMGDEFLARGTFTLRARVPARAHLRLILNGFCVAETTGVELAYSAHVPGAYRLEAYRPFMFKRRGWIYSNPIFVRTEREGPAQ